MSKGLPDSFHECIANKGEKFRSWADSGIYIFIIRLGKSKGLKLRVDTFCWDLKLAALDDLDILNRAVRAFFRDVFDYGDDVHALKNFPENNVTSIKPTTHQVSTLLASITDNYQYWVWKSHCSFEPQHLRKYSRSNNSSDEELGAICILSGVGHGKKTGAGVLYYIFPLVLMRFKVST